MYLVRNETNGDMKMKKVEKVLRSIAMFISPSIKEDIERLERMEKLEDEMREKSLRDLDDSVNQLLSYFC